MSTHGTSDAEIVRTAHNTARYFTEHRQISWVVLAFVVLAGIYGYLTMPKRKDPDIPVRVAAVVASWPGATSEQIELLVTRKIEDKLAENKHVDRIESTTRSGTAILTVRIEQSVTQTGPEFDDLQLRLDQIKDLPEGVQVRFNKDFGDTTALMLTVASPKVGEVELQLRAGQIRRALEATRAGATVAEPRATVVVAFPQSINPSDLRELAEQWLRVAQAGGAEDARLFQGPGFLGVDAATSQTDAQILARLSTFIAERVRTTEIHPDAWRPVVIRDPADTEARLAAVAGDRYSYRELDEFTDSIQKRLHLLDIVSTVDRAGVLPETVTLEYSQEKLTAYNESPQRLSDALRSRNITAPGGVLELSGKSIAIDPSGEFKSEREIGGVILGRSTTGSPLYLRDVVQVSRGYQSPPGFLNYYTWRDAKGRWQRSRAVTIAVSMRAGSQIASFGEQVDRALAEVRQTLPEDLIYARTSDQPLQVTESVDLFIEALLEAIALVVLVALIGFWEWRAALVMALSIPITLLMTFGLMRMLGIDIQQVSIASLIIALGLLVDDPVVASDAIKRSLADGWKGIVAGWLGPTKLATAILFATITNIVAYLPFLGLPDDSGRFIFSLPIVLGCSLAASRVVSMTFIPLLGYYLLRPPKKAEPSIEERRNKGFARQYARVVGWAINHRGKVLAAAAALLVLTGFAVRGVKTAFFPKDLSYLSYVDVWLPEDATIETTREGVDAIEAVIIHTLDEWGKKHEDKRGPREVLRSLTSFIGAGGPRFWFSVAPEQRQKNYAQLLIEVRDKHDTQEIVDPLQRALASSIPGARADVRQLETGQAVGIPVGIRIRGEEIDTLRKLAERAKAIYRATPHTQGVRDDWGADAFTVRLEVDPDRANLAGVTNLDVARSSSAALSGDIVGTLHEGDRNISVLTRLRPAERAQLTDVENLYIVSSSGGTRVPLRQVSRIAYGMTTEKIVRRNHYRTVTVSCFPADGLLPSQVVAAAKPQMDKLIAELPPGYAIETAGELEESSKSFKNLAVVLAAVVAALFIALVVQFKSAAKPLVVFAAIPFGMIAGLTALRITGQPFGFVAFLGLISLVGVIVSHVIVLFDFIEERHALGEPLREALIDAGIIRLRPVLVTVGATVLGLFPLATHGGPLWEPLCYVQIGGLTFATVVTLVLVPTLYTAFVLDLKIVRWEQVRPEGVAAAPERGQIAKEPPKGAAA